MDRLIRIPGVKKRLGLNPILDLIPGFGDIAAALVSVSVLGYGIRRGIPKILLGRMALNVVDPLKRSWERGVYMGADSTNPEAVQRHRPQG